MRNKEPDCLVVGGVCVGVTRQRIKGAIAEVLSRFSISNDTGSNTTSIR